MKPINLIVHVNLPRNITTIFVLNFFTNTTISAKMALLRIAKAMFMSILRSRLFFYLILNNFFLV